MRSHSPAVFYRKLKGPLFYDFIACVLFVTSLFVTPLSCVLARNGVNRTVLFMRDRPARSGLAASSVAELLRLKLKLKLDFDYLVDERTANDAIATFADCL